MASAWPRLQTLDLFGGSPYAVQAPLSILNAFSRHFGQTLERLGLSYRIDVSTLVQQPVAAPFSTLQFLDRDVSPIVPEDQIVVSAFLGLMLPRGTGVSAGRTLWQDMYCKWDVETRKAHEKHKQLWRGISKGVEVYHKLRRT